MRAWLRDFPGTNACHAIALLLILLTGLVVIVRLGCGRPFPAGYDGWLTLLAALSGVSTLGTIGKRLSDIDYRRAATSPVNVEAPSTVTITESAGGSEPGS